MTYEEMKQQLEDYNWDDGFDFPRQIVSNLNCDLALALEVFYLSDGYAFLIDKEKNDCRLKEWLNFVEKLYIDIEKGCYIKSKHKFEIPLTKVQCYNLRKKNVPEVFLSSV